jgi:hypothetical protein
MARMFSPRAVMAAALAAVLVAASTKASERTATAMSSAAADFLQSLTPEQRQQASFPFDSGERLKWHFIPIEMFPRNGLTLRTMSEPQRKLGLALLRTGLSQRGYMTATEIIALETILGDVEAAARASASADPARSGRTPMVRDPELYYFSVFGTPSAKGTWGWRVEGHHLSLHFTTVKGSLIAGAPSFFGANPAEVRSGPRAGFRALGLEEDAARELLMALDPARRTKAVIAETAPNDIATMNSLPINPLSPGGIAAADMTADQRELLMKVVDVYAGYMTPDVATARMEKIRRAGVEKVAFAWAGEAERGKKHYYRVQGPTFLIEYDNTQDGGNHIHSVWRDFEGDFGRDLLREHLQAYAH